MVGRIRAKAGANYLRAVMLRNRACLVRKCVVSLNLWRRSCIKIHTWIMCEVEIVDRVWTLWRRSAVGEVPRQGW